MATESTLGPYPDPEARERELEQLVTRASRVWPGIEILDYGHSVEGRVLRAVRIPRAKQAGPRPPKVLICANAHGPEFIGNRVCVGVLSKLGLDEQPPVLRELLARAELWLAPCLNPDGYARTHAAGGVGSLAELRHNHRGVDLNRNWPLPTGGRRLPFPGAGSETPGDATYRGEQPLSEPETAALDALLEREDFHASANLHSFMGTLFPPRVRSSQDFSNYRRLCRSFRQAQDHTRYTRIASRVFDTFTGEQEDHQHHSRRCWSVCVECFPLRASLEQNWGQPKVLFWRFNPRDPQPWVDNDLPGVAAFLLAALELERPIKRPIERPIKRSTAD